MSRIFKQSNNIILKEVLKFADQNDMEYSFARNSYQILTDLNHPLKLTE